MSDAEARLVGGLVRDPELKFTNKGLAVASFSVAVNRKKGEDDVTSYFDCTAFGSVAENVANSFKKGDRVILFGTLTQDRWETEAGDKRSKVVVLIDAIGSEVRFGTTTYTKNAPKGEKNAPTLLADESPF